MRHELSFKTAVCSEYERLLRKCQSVLEIWHQRRDEICQSRLTGKEVGDELLRLQADYAKAYRGLRKHADGCQLCQFVSKVGGRESVRPINLPA